MIAHRLADSCIQQVLQRHAERTPDAIAIAAPNRTPISYRRLWAHVVDIAGVLRAFGLGPGDRVALVLPDGPEMAVAFLAVSAVGTAAPLNPSCRQSEFESHLSDLNVKMLIASAADDSPAVAAARKTGVRVVRLTCAAGAPAGVFLLADSPIAHPTTASLSRGLDVALVLTTSGTTSRPKIVALTHANIYASAINIGASLGLRADDRCLDVMPLFHVHGLIGGLLSSLAAGASVVCPPGFDAPRFFDWIDELEPTWYTAVPTMHQAILARAGAHREIIAHHPLRFIRSSSSALPEPVRTALEREFNAPVIEAYGMTEASHQIASNPRPPGVRKAGSVGVASGADAAIMDERGNLLPPGETGEIVIRGASVMAGYQGDSSVNEHAFTNGWLRTGDAGHLDEDGYLFITDRLKETINRGGEKIGPREVDDVLLNHPAVAEAVAFGLPHETLGHDVAAAIVLRPGVPCTERELREFVGAKLAHFKVPARVFFVDRLPKSPTGKLQRNRLAEQLGIQAGKPTSPAVGAAFVAPSTPLEQTLAAMWAEILGVAPVGIHDNFFDLGGDSVLAARVVARVRGELDADLSLVTLFDRPTLAEMARAVAAAIANRRVQASTEAHDGGARRPAIPAVRRDAFRAQRTPLSDPAPVLDAPLSFGQQRLWFIDQWQPGNGVFNSRVPIWLTGPLRVTALEQSLAAIVRRHAVLRASFPSNAGQPVQRIARALPIPLPVVDLRELPDHARASEVNRLITEETRRPFDLSRGPLVRASLIRVDPTNHVLLLTIHHIVFDGWSRAVLLRELSAFYTSFVRGEPASLSPLPLQYTDYAQREAQQSDDRHLAFWTKQLGGDLPMLALPTDYSRPPVADLRGGQHERLLPRRLTDALEALSRREGVTPFMTLLAAFKVLLSRYAGVEDMLVGSPIAGRTDVETEGLIGFFVKTLILRTNLSGNPSFQELLGRVRAVTLDALDHQALPFQKLVDALRAERFLNRNPICDVTLNFLNTPDLDLDLPGVTARYVEPPEALSEFSLTMQVVKKEGTLAISMIYQRALFSPERIALILDQFESLLEQIVAAPDRPIGAYSLVAPASRRLLPDPSAPLPEPRYEPVTTTFFSQAVRAPSAIAVTQAGRAWTYGELAECADALARVLIAGGHQPGDVVAVTGAPSFGVIASIVAVLSSGGVLLTIDPDLPVERKRLMLHEAVARRLVHVADCRDADDDVREFASCPVIGVDGRTGRPLDAAFEAPPHDVLGQASASSTLLYEPGPDGPAYIFFTSGTSGIPKGVLGSHQGLAHFLGWQRAHFAVTPQDRCAQLTSLSFDVVLRDVFLPLVSGATLCLPESSWHAGDDVLTWLDRERITLLHTGPALVGSWLALEPAGVSLRRLRCVFFAGEPLTGGLVRRWRDAFPESGEIVNLYGATEATLAQCFYVVPADAPPGVQPVGWPLPDTQALVLTKDRQLCGIGERGEIAMRTRFLTFGYVNAPDETRSRFVKNPSRDDDRDLLYLTGDEGRYRPDGALEILGRLDDQIKIRGVRVELEEVNVQLLEHPSVKSSCVVSRKNEHGEPSIVAYVVPSDPEGVSARELRTFVNRRLPSAMVPATFVFLEELPLTPNGKVDRRALAALASFRAERTHESTPLPVRPDPASESDLALSEPAARPSDAERHRLLIEWNDTARVYPDQMCVHQLVEAQVDRTPGAIAVVCGREQISYEALNARANQLARLLRKRGVGPDVVVGLCLERSIELVVALLGILKAGGAYVPLDPSYPQERLRFMLEDAAARVLVTEARLAERLGATAADVVCLETDRELFASDRTDNLESGATPDNLAYVIFTSGSTGRPKGVMIPHRAICNHMFWMQTAFPLTSDDRVLQRTPCSFDASVWEFYAPLLAGAELIMAAPGSTVRAVLASSKSSPRTA